MIGRMVNRINTLSKPARYMIYIGIISGLLLLSCALYISVCSGRGLKDLYLSCHMSETAAILFAEGIVCGLIYEFFTRRT